MQLYNTLTRTVEELKPLNGSDVTIYTCGPTVYDYPHIGNWFTFVRYDILVRTLKASGFKPRWIMNITDVGHLVSDADDGEDKLEKGARREGKTAWDVAKFYGDYFTEALKRLNFTQPDELPKATEHIQEQIDMIKTLEDKGFAYVIDDGVYYDTSKFEGYAAFARLDLDDLQEGARVAVNEQKRNAADFALWKFSPADHQRDMEWDSPWGKGFPGWHIECSAMAKKYLGDTIDIHAGGIDHVPVHHTNEIAQSEAANGMRFANYWFHANHILIGEDKISKSLGNGITLEDIEQKDYSLEALRLHILESHYRSQSKFSWDSLEAAKNRLNSYFEMADQLWQATSAGKVNTEMIEQVKGEISKIMQEDLDTPRALARLSFIENRVASNGLFDEAQQAFKEFLTWLDTMFGTNLASRSDISDSQKQLIIERSKTREANDWQKSDELRSELLKQGLGVRDTDYGPTWYRV